MLPQVYTEDDWNSESTLVTAPYNYSKTQAEKWAWDFVKNLPEAEKIELETINPAMGTFLRPPGTLDAIRLPLCVQCPA